MIWKSSVRVFASKVLQFTLLPPFSTKEVSFFVFELFQKYSASKDCFGRLFTEDCTHTVKFIKLANMITLKRSLIAQSQKLVTAYTRPQVRIVSFNFSDNYNIKRNTTMNVMGLYYVHYITQEKSRTTKIL